MERTHYILRRVLVLLMLGILFLPLLQNTYTIFTVKNLKGSFKVLPDIQFSFAYWIDGVFQENKEAYLAQNFGLRNTSIRFNNQLRFYLFKTNNNAEVVIGKNNQLYAKAYLESYTGENFVGVDSIVARSIAIKQLQDKMLAQGKIFLPVLAPNKARVLHQYLPDNVRVKNMSNYEVYVQCFKKLQVRYLDFNAYFIENYHTSKYPLYSKYGVHWSTYGHSFAADSIVRHLNAIYGLHTPVMKLDSIVLSDSLRQLDYDAGDGLNLFVNQLPSEKLAYPKCRFFDTTNTKPPIFVVGDSYNFGLDYTHMYTKVFSRYKFLYYLREIMPYQEDENAFLKLRLKQELDSHQVFLMVATEHNLINYGWGFVEKALNVMNGRKDDFLDDYTRDELITEARIRKDKAWFADLQRNAFLTKKDVNVVITEAATFITDKKYGRKSKGTPMQEMVKAIKADPKWVNEAAERARNMHAPLDTVIFMDAKWQLQHPKH